MGTDLRTRQPAQDPERTTAVSPTAPHGPSGRPARGNGRWIGPIAGAIAFLLLAGGVGFIAQRDDPSASTVGLLAGGAEAGATAPDESVTAADGVSRESEGSPTGVDVASSTTPRGDLTKIIRNGRLVVIVEDGRFPDSVTAVTRVANGLGGIIVESSSRDQSSGTFVLRIPSKKFDVAMTRLRSIGEVRAERVTTDDVTAEFVDLQARLTILLDRRALLRGLQSDATTSEEILRLGDLIGQTQLEIEQIQGQLRYLRNQVSLATIAVELREADATAPAPAPDPANPSLVDSFQLGVQGFLRVLGVVIVGLGYLIPLAAIALFGWGAITLVRTRRRAAS